MNYDPENCSVVLTDCNDKEHHITGFAADLVATEQLWHKLISVEDDVYTVECKDQGWNVWLVPFTKEGYDKHIKDLKPTVESPFVFNKVTP